jgi:hypothetical protein
MPLSVMQPKKKISSIPKKCLIILRTPKQNFIKKISSGSRDIAFFSTHPKTPKNPKN